ncbi:2OG-Fe(II) oxygenase [Bacillus cereus]|uniref:2OG-Fe(II) oxygenase n=1 Tax=Bacillus cereus group TaxID=86661 RepID=UPI0025B0920D|nr:2OG-Fe(II) oxygenase [Bacillus cereus]MEC3196184.1 2OG-Fe(II) oxygenase [Bacillus cereus]WJX08153.1 2OG-Fe(II) oxygenase [Bacillus cereus]
MNAIEKEIVLFDGKNIYQDPYKHISVQKVLSPIHANEILNWLEHTDLFLRRNENNNKSNEFIVKDDNCPKDLRFLVSSKGLKFFKIQLEKLFQITFEDNFILSAVKHEPGDGTSIHSDYANIHERSQNFFTHRFLVYLNRQWSEEDGGMLGLFASKDSSSLIKVISPLHNTGIGIAFGKNSYHAVGKICNGNRYSLVFTLKSMDGCYEEEIQRSI